MAYTVYIYDLPLLRFSFESSEKQNGKTKYRGLNRSGIDEERISISWHDKDNERLLPCELLDLHDGTIRAEKLENRTLRWLRSRKPPANRQFIRNLLMACGLRGRNIAELADFCQMLSLNDAYRVSNDNLPFVPFAKCNLYENRFDEMLSLAAYLGIQKTDEPVRRASVWGGLRSTPELTTQGMLPKAWRWTNEGIVLYKGGTSGFANSGLEPYSELYAFQIAERMGLSAVAYGLERWHGILASTCRLFTSRDISYVPAYSFLEGLNACGIDECIEAFDRYGMIGDLKKLFLFDALVCNPDRHYSNFGILRDNRSGRIIGMAPIFDNGQSLLCSAMDVDLEDRERYVGTLCPPYEGVEFEDLAAFALAPSHADELRGRLRRLIGFEFAKHPQYNLPSARLNILSELIHDRTSRFLGMRTRTLGTGTNLEQDGITKDEIDGGLER